MVAGFIGRQNSSPINGETVFHNSNIPPQNGGGGNRGHQISANGNPRNVNEQLQYCGQENGNSSVSMDDAVSPSPSSPMSDHMHSNYDSNHASRKDLFSQRKQREFIPDNKKDESYWDRRRRNNEAAKRSREKRRFNDMILEQRVVELSKENHILKAQLAAIQEKFGINGENIVSVEAVMATLPSNEQVLSITKRTKLSTSTPLLYPASPSRPVPTSVIHQAPVHANAASIDTNSSSSGRPLYAQSPPRQRDSNPYQESDSYSSYFSPVLPLLHPPMFEAASNSVLNLSRSRSSGPPSPYELSGASSDENSAPVSLTLPSTQTAANNSLPHKLRHKSRLGDKEVATSTLLSLQSTMQMIKEEPARGSPPWDGEGSSDERDSGISLGTEWNNVKTKTSAKSMVKMYGLPTPPIEGHRVGDVQMMKSQVESLVNEVAALKNYMFSRERIQST